MRRALIPVLTRTKDFSAALDQYIEVLNRYPEDEALAREAAVLRVGERNRAEASRLLRQGRERFAEGFSLADGAGENRHAARGFPGRDRGVHARGVGVRPDRADLLTARLNLEERLLRFDEAGATAEQAVRVDVSQSAIGW